MQVHTKETPILTDVSIAPDVLDYIAKRECDFRVCTSCGGPILLPTKVKPPKNSDFLLKAGNQAIYVSIHQARYLHVIRRDMIPFFEDSDLGEQEDNEF
jgi:hypothetical protein